MDYKSYKKTVTKKPPEKPICQYCFDDTKDKKEYFWVDRETHYILSCIDCIESRNLIINRPYFESKRKEKSVDVVEKIKKSKKEK